MLILSVDAAVSLSRLTFSKFPGLQAAILALTVPSLTAGSVGIIHAISPSALPPNGTTHFEKQSASLSLIA